MKRFSWILILMVFIGLKASAQLPANDTLKFSAHKKEISTFLNLLNTAGLADPSQPVTIFAPENKAFENLPVGILDSLSKPANKQALIKLLNNDIISGKISAKDFSKLIHQNNGHTIITAISGNKLIAKIDTNRNIVLIDESDRESIVKVFDLHYGNSTIFIISSVLQSPK